MDRREFTGLLALSPLLASAAKMNPAATSKPLVLLAESARVYDIGHGEARILAGAEQSGGGWWFGSFLTEQGRKTSLHLHHSMDEQFYVLEGVLSVWIGGHWQDLPSGSLATAPRGMPHALGNRSKQSVRFLASGNPAGFEGFFADIEALAHRYEYGSSEFLAELKKVYTKYDSELLAPPPQD